MEFQEFKSHKKNLLGGFFLLKKSSQNNLGLWWRGVARRLGRGEEGDSSRPWGFMVVFRPLHLPNKLQTLCFSTAELAFTKHIAFFFLQTCTETHYKQMCLNMLTESGPITGQNNEFLNLWTETISKQNVCHLLKRKPVTNRGLFEHLDRKH